MDKTNIHIVFCKFCGKEIHNGKYLNNRKEGSCGECGSYCMKKCEKASNTSMSWHKEPCVSCKHNPYRIKYKWDGKRWVKND